MQIVFSQNYASSLEIVLVNAEMKLRSLLMLLNWTSFNLCFPYLLDKKTAIIKA